MQKQSHEHEITLVILGKVCPTASSAPPCQAFSSPMKGLIVPVCARRMSSSGVAYLALLRGAEITYYHPVQSHLGSEQR